MGDEATGWQLRDEHTVRDLTTFLSRAVRLDRDAEVRIQAVGSVAAVYVCAIHGVGLPIVLCLRTIGLAMPTALDALVSCQSVLDRLARAENGTWLPKPPVEEHAAWAGVLPPRGGWSVVGQISADDLREIAEAGIREIAAGTPQHAGSAAVTQLRAMVWSRPIPIEPVLAELGSPPGIAAGAAFGAQAFGFLRPGASVTVATTGPWTRLDAPGGHVLTRRSLI